MRTRCSKRSYTACFWKGLLPRWGAGILTGACGLVLLFVAGCDLLGGAGEPPDLIGKIVFAAEVEGADNIYTINADGSDLRQLTSFDGDAAIQPSWSPDGQTIAFASFHMATTVGPYLYLIDADGTNQRFLKEFEQDALQALAGFGPTWSPDGKRIAFSICVDCEAYGQNWEAFAVKVAGRVLEEGELINLSDHPARDGGVVWSPTRQQIAFSSNRETGKPREMDAYLADPDGANVMQLTEGTDIDALHWSPDGENLVIAMRGDKIVFLNVTTGRTKRVKVEGQENGRLVVEDWAVNGDVLLSSSGDGKERLVALNPKSGRTTELKMPLPDAYDLKGADWYVELGK